MQLDFRVTELLCSRLCHDLVSPVGAVNNGVELLEDPNSSAETVRDGMDLIGDSARIAADRLKFFRLAYGAAGNDRGLPSHEIFDILERYLSPLRVKVIRPQADAMPDRPDVSPKLLMNLCLLAGEALPQGGTLRFDVVRGGIQVIAEGRNAGLQEAAAAACDGTVAVDDLGPRNVHAYVTGQLAGREGLAISRHSPAAGTAVFHLGKA